MKSPDFFISKAKEYSNTIDEILNNYFSRYSKEAFDSTKEYLNQKTTISDLKLKIKLLFSEFENGDLFKSEVMIADENIGFNLNEDERLKIYSHVLSLFIEHVIEFRK